MPKYRAKAQVKANLNLWLNDLFLRDGFYSTTSTGEQDVYGRDLSLLIATQDASYADNRVYQSAFKNWVHESGLIPSSTGIIPPLVSSGITVNGMFYPTSPLDPGYVSAFGHKTDFPNGRVIFDSPISSASVVQGEFSYKSIAVDNASTFENETKEFYFETSLKDNPQQTGVITYPKENSRTLPLVLIDIISKNNEAYELGVASNTALISASLIVWTRDEYMKDQIDDLLTIQGHTVLLGVDFNKAPQLLDFAGDKNPAFTNYDDFARLDSPNFWHRIYIDEANSRRLQPYYNMERLQINFSIRVYPNF